MEEISYTCPVSYHIMENYLLMRDNAPEEAKRQLDLYLELARREILLPFGKKPRHCRACS